MRALLIRQGQSGRQLIIASCSDVSHGFVLSGFKEMWLVGSLCLQGSGAETQLKSSCYLQFDRNSVSVVNRPEALFLRLFDADQNLIS